MLILPKWLRWLLAGILITSIVGGFAIDLWMDGHTSRELQARHLEKAGDYDEAAALYWEALQKEPLTVPLVVGFLDARIRVGMPPPKKRKRSGGNEEEEDPGELQSFGHGKRTRKFSIEDHPIEPILQQPGVPHEVALLGGYWADVQSGAVSEEEEAAVRAAADATPPLRWANHLLARRGEHGDILAVENRLLREGLTFDQEDDVATALLLMEGRGDWAAVGEKLADPKIASMVPTYVRFRYAIEMRRWPDAAKLSFAAAYGGRFGKGPLILAFVAAVTWLAFFLRLARASEPPRSRLAIFLVAPVMGALSIMPTDALIAIQESFLHLDETGNPLNDALYYVFGVGFREELSKLLLFVPLVPFLRTAKASRLDVLVAGALVGLGFAAVENLQYFTRDDLASAIARFLTANFLHMAMTGLCAAALWDASRDPQRRAYDGSRTFLLVMVLHGAYDFFIGMPGSLSFLSVIVFVVLGRRFTNELHQVRGRVGRGVSTFDLFLAGSALLTGVSFVYACAVVGPSLATRVLLQGVIGEMIIGYFVVQELRRL